MSNQSFFDEDSEVSQVKSQIVAKYFWAWAQVMLPRVKTRGNKIAYIDLFAGPGRYKNGAKSMPVMILETAIRNPEMAQRLVTLFNDVDAVNISSLRQAIDELPNINTLRYKPKIMNEEIGTQIVSQFEQASLVPTFFFVDPWGYKGLSLQLINSVLKNWGCDCIFFFNYNRINMGLHNSFVEEHMNALFGKVRADQLRVQLASLLPQEREVAVVEALSQALKEMGGNYVLPFRFTNSAGSRTSHHLIFVSKNVLGYDIMKQIMAKESSDKHDGVPSFDYNPATIRQPFLFQLARPLEELGDLLMEQFAGMTLPMKKIYQQHNVGTRYIAPNYKATLAMLEANGKIIANPPATKRRKETFGDDVVVSFPAKEV